MRLHADPCGFMRFHAAPCISRLKLKGLHTALVVFEVYTGTPCGFCSICRYRSRTTKQKQQEPTEVIETQQPCYSPTPIVPHLAAQSNYLGEWPLIFTYEQKKKWAARASSECQHMNSDFTKSKRFYTAESYNRFCKEHFLLMA